MITNPTVIVEVLSDSTERYDRDGKFKSYQSLRRELLTRRRCRRFWMPYRTPRDPKRRLPLSLERITVRTPCSAAWDEMVGDETARFCCICSKTVYDLAAMDGSDAEAFLARELEGDERTCARLVRRPDGRVLTSECGPGVVATLDDDRAHEDEYLGTAARTERALAARRSSSDEVLPGTVRLVRSRRSGL